MAASMLPDERYTIDSTAKIWMAISASFSFIMPKSPICFPKALRSFAYFEAVVSTFFEPPTQEAPGVQNIEGHDVPAADFMQHVFFRHLAVFQENRSRRASVDAHLVLFVAGLESGKSALDDEGREFFSVDLRKHNVNIGEAAVSDPHLLPIEDVVRAFFIQFRARQRILRVGPRLRFGKAVGANPFA